MKRPLLSLLWLLPLGALAQQPTTVSPARREEGNLVIERIPTPTPALRERLNAYQNARSAGLLDWDHQGGIYISTRFGDAAQVHHVAAPGADRRQLTFFPEPVGGASVSPDPKHNGFVFSKDVGGNENRQNYWFDRATGQYTLLTDGKSQNGGVLWSTRGDRYVYNSTRRNGRDYDLYMAPVGNPKAEKRLLEVSGSWNAADWSPDDQTIVAQEYISANESHLFLLDVATGKATPLNPKNEKISYGSALFSEDGKGLYLVSDEGTEFHTLRYYNLATKQQTPLTAGISWDVDEMEMTPKGDLLAFTVNADGFSELYLLTTKTGKYERVKNVPQGLIGGLKFSRDGQRLGYTFSNAKTAGDVYSLALKGNQTTRWTQSEIGGLNPATLVEPSLVRYPTFDQINGQPRQIPAFVYKPASRKGKLPVIINIHGGPEGQARPGFDPSTQYMVQELGVAVIFPNVRGSSGYGKTYLAADNGMKREDSVQDIGKLLDWIATQPDLDAGRVAVYGGSYGGYMVLACMTNFNNRLRAGIDVVGISNFVTFLESTSEYRRDLRRAEYGDERDPAMRAYMQKIAPLNNVQKITKPMMIVQGQNDPRVPYTEAEQMLSALKKNGNDVYFLMAKDEGHGFRKKSNRDYQSAAMSEFIEQYLVSEQAK
ncbi:S9 family peptidase [Hymenobacter sp. BT188]|uniref:S9 family peptidase n=1 Tax=Hymenobacter sp. BT188 TaxID=2763504 RepID=UPI001651A371|nr:prolyl oligopeptidase family serine peptidase [Hymenobacter sp. BT188]MBC6608238.1 S9 family peptidase [Hymenobacter sp. BT188]